MLYMLEPCRNCRSSAFYSFSQRLRFMVYFIPIPFSCQPKGNGGKPARSVICHTLSGGAHSFLSLLGSFPGKEAEVEKGRIYVFLNSPWLCKCMCYRVTIILYRILPLLPGYNNLPRTTVPWCLWNCHFIVLKISLLEISFLRVAYFLVLNILLIGLIKYSFPLPVFPYSFLPLNWAYCFYSYIPFISERVLGFLNLKHYIYTHLPAYMHIHIDAHAYTY